MNHETMMLCRSLEICATYRGKKRKAEEEKRVDTDNNPYTKEEFIEFYGSKDGTQKFNNAPIYVPGEGCFCGNESYDSNYRSLYIDHNILKFVCNFVFKK